MIVSGDNETRILHFQKRREAAHGKSYLKLYEAHLDAHVFVYLYLRPATCSLVWRGRLPGHLDTTLPFEFLDTQFANLPPSKIKIIKRPIQKFGSSMLHKPYKLKKCVATLFPASEERLREYDILQNPDNYMAEVVESKDVLADIAFAKFDCEVEYQNQNISYSLTFERLGESANDDWEFTVSVPRSLKIEESTLKWIAKHHGVGEMLRMDFKASLDELSKMLRPQKEPIPV